MLLCERDQYSAGGPGRLEVFLHGCKSQSDPALILITGGQPLSLLRTLYRCLGRTLQIGFSLCNISYFVINCPWRQHLELASLNFTLGIDIFWQNAYQLPTCISVATSGSSILSKYYCSRLIKLMCVSTYV